MQSFLGQSTRLVLVDLNECPFYRLRQFDKLILQHIVRGALFEEFNGLVVTDGSGNGDERDTRTEGFRQQQRRRRVEIWKSVVGQNKIVFAALQESSEFLLVGSPVDLHGKTSVDQPFADDLGIFA